MVHYALKVSLRGLILAESVIVIVNGAGLVETCHQIVKAIVAVRTAAKSIPEINFFIISSLQRL